MSCPGCPRPDSHCAICDTHGALDEKGECFNAAEHPSTQPARKSRAKKKSTVSAAEPSADWVCDDVSLVASVTSAVWTPQHAADYVTESWRGAVESIIVTGHRLIEAKERVGHGQWLPTVELLPFGEQTARRLMAVAEHPELANPSTWTDLPAAWRTLFELSALPEGEIARAIEAGTITSDTTTREAAELAEAHRPDFTAHQEAQRAARGAEVPGQTLAPQQATPVHPQPVDEPGDIVDAEVVDEDTDAGAAYGPDPGPEHDTPTAQAKLSKPSKAAIRAMRSFIPALTSVTAAANSVPEFDFLPSLEARRAWLNTIQQARRVLLTLERDIKSTMDSPGDEQ